MTPMTAVTILSRIKSLELQITALRIEVEKFVEQEGKGSHTFADLKGILAGQGNFSEEEIDAALYQLPPGFEDEIATVPKEPGR